MEREKGSEKKMNRKLVIRGVVEPTQQKHCKFTVLLSGTDKHVVNLR